ncbi:NAD(P)H-dependent oxidoreductase [Crenobacter sp. SG2305]|uniref:glutathione-regulated potassium-efflux system oxidoreductase KefF n=1 Tax=Crenobacter oryzisoli TaxID=3056844 RepID=UPI0025AA95C3|nr:NAD(P)H-dependent oxidoreductase [Crenobacter sp. SG2305]MDN0083041.1 NAD(P)H-dependent oxidoreductase [Crenobacter sp. SG2305]
MKTLIIYAHPNHRDSRVNRALLDVVRKLPGVTVHPLYHRYPDGFIDAAHEQALLTEHQLIVLQHPLYWFSCPSLLKEWLDSVLTRGWAYGRGGEALAGKYLVQAISAGGTDDSYRTGGQNGFTVAELLRPFEMTAHLCGLHYLAPFVTHGSRVIESQALTEQARAYRDHLLALCADPAAHRLDSRETCQ